MRIKGILIGTAHPHSGPYQATLVQVPQLELVAVVDDGGSVSERLSGLPIYPSLESLLAAQPEIPFDVAFVFLPGDRIVPVAEALIQAGKHLFCDKPVTRTAEEMAHVAHLARERGITFCAGYQWRMHPIVRWIKEVLADGCLGRLQHVEARLITTTVAARGPGHYLFDRARSGGGIVHWLGCHHIDLLRYLAGEEVISVSATTATVTDAGVDIEDLAHATLRFEGGCLAALQQGYLLPVPTDNPFTASSYDMFLGLWGTLGWLRWDLTTAEVELYSTHPRFAAAPGRRLSFSLAEREGYGGVAGYDIVRSFLTAARAGADAPVTPEDALRTLEIIEAIYASAASGRAVTLSG
ncbi:MAG TPA: Gfo/Idh/MocA family oxidoreductase [Limnochordia bacterium]